MSKSQLIVILGPTAVGKSEVALEVASHFGGEIVNADSQQVYRGMDIGTGKPCPPERKKIAHHLIDIVDPDEEFSVGRFRQLALEAVRQISERGNVAIVCGGTGLYLKALTQGLFIGPSRDREIRVILEGEIESTGLGSLYDRLGRVDPAATRWIHPNDRQRIVRALEVYETTGKPLSRWQKEHAFNERAFVTLKIGLHRERSELYDRINRRCEKMAREGLIEEVSRLMDHGYSLNLRTMKSVGYRHMGWVVDGAMSLEDALALMKRDTRRLAKRQLTWFRRDPEVRWFQPETDRLKILESVKSFLEAPIASKS